MKRYKVTLSKQERESLRAMLKSGKASANKLMRARVLLKADASKGGPGWIDSQIVEALDIGVSTVERIRQQFVEEGLEAALNRKQQERPSRARILDGRGEAQLIALACSAPPEGRSQWTLQLLANGLVELNVVDTISDETVRRTLKKTNSSRGSKNNGA